MTETALDAPYSTGQKLFAEALGTFLLVLGVIGAALFSSENTGLMGPALSIGLAIVIGAYAVGRISGGHFNPAVSIGLAVAGKFSWKDVPGYAIAQIIGGLIASSVVAFVASGQAGTFAEFQDRGFAANGYGDFYGGYSVMSVLTYEAVLTAVLVGVVLGVTSRRAPVDFAPLTIGLTVTVIHLISIPVSNTSVNPARSLAAAVYAGPEALGQLWVFFVAPIAGGIIAAVIYRALASKQ